MFSVGLCSFCNECMNGRFRPKKTTSNQDRISEEQLSYRSVYVRYIGVAFFVFPAPSWMCGFARVSKAQLCTLQTVSQTSLFLIIDPHPLLVRK